MRYDTKATSRFPAAWLFTPGSRPDRFSKAAGTEADVLILDLEDAVAQSGKADARGHVLEFLVSPAEYRQEACIRINPLTCADGLEDLAALARSPFPPDYILLPKSEDPSTIAMIGRVLAGEAASTRLVALIETAKGVAQASDIACSAPQLAALFFGAADYAADLGQRVEFFEPDFARQSIVNAAASGGIVAIDSPHFAIGDPEALARDCQRARAMGFAAKAAIHPSQIAMISQAFAPTEEELVLAERIRAAAPDGVGVLDGKMIDIAMVRWANRVG